MRLAIFALLLAGTSLPALAQTGDLTGRVDRIEKELHAVQRKVFPGGDAALAEPQITAPATIAADGGTPASSAVSDLSQRVTALEAQVRDLTNQSEVGSHRLDQIEQKAAKLQADTEYRLRQLESTAPPGTLPPPTVPNDGGDLAPARKPARARPAPAADAGDTMGAQAAAPVAPVEAAAAPATTGDPAEDGYMAGYALWTQKRYPEAEAALKEVVAKYPTSKRASYAQNLLGRTYMDDGQLSSAADAFLTSYKKFPRGERAPDSLYYLGQTLTKLKKQAQACQVYDELRDVYGATLNATLKTRVTQGRADAKCGA